GNATSATTPEPAEPSVASVVDITSARRTRRQVVLAAVAAVAAALIGVVVVQTVRVDDGVQIADVVEADDAVSVELTGELQGLRVVRSPERGAIALLGDGVTPPRDDQVYELWLIEDEPARVETFRPDADGRVEVLVADMDPGENAVFAITAEPLGGSSSPTGPVLAMTTA
nr:anti-sigma factor [Acidimicrobiia bacterium]